MKIKYLIIGAGIGGLSAGAFLKERGEEFVVIEKGSSVPNNLSNGLHYLHDTDFELPFQMSFKKCTLTENIWDTKTNQFTDKAMLPDLFSYSRKVMDNLRHPSSIMDPGKRECAYVPESNDMNELIVKYTEYIGEDNFIFNTTVNQIDLKKKIAVIGNGQNDYIEYEYLITTAPLNLFIQMIGEDSTNFLKHKPLHITNYKAKNVVPNWLIILYMADQKFPPYRITCFNNIISMESLYEMTHDDEVIVKYIAGDLFDYDLDSVSKYKWETGRIFGLTREQRMKLVTELAKYNVFPVGRFALWNGKLLLNSTIRQSKAVVDGLGMQADYEAIIKKAYGKE